MRTSMEPLHRRTAVARAVILLTSVVVFGFAVGCSPGEMSDAGAPESVELSAPDASQQVLAFRNQHMTAMTDRRDMQRILSHFTEDAVYLPPDGEAAVGREAIHAYLVDFFSSGLFGVDFDNHQTMVDGDLAVLRDSYSMVIVPRSGTQTQHSGDDVWVLRRVDGEWKVALVMWTGQPPRGDGQPSSGEDSTGGSH